MTLKEYLSFLQLDEVKDLCKRLHVSNAGSKQEIAERALKHCRQQRSLFSTENSEARGFKMYWLIACERIALECALTCKLAGRCKSLAHAIDCMQT